MNVLVIYHKNCMDGFGAALSAEMYFSKLNYDYRLVAARHGEELSHDLTALADTSVYLADFAYPRQEMEQLCRAAKKVIVLDHHISAKRDLENLDAQYKNLELHFDMHRSGAVIAWEYFHQSPPPLLLRCIQDRDLWQFEVPNSADINAALMSRPFDLAAWQTYVDDETALQTLAAEGVAINRFRQQMILYYGERAVIGDIAGFRVPVVNCPREVVSELLGQLAQDQPFAASYSDRGDTRIWSLRSTAEGEDVSAIAKRFGGGGHQRAAGFTSKIPLDLIHL